MNKTVGQTVNFVLDGIVFTGVLLKRYTFEGVERAAVKVAGYAVNGRYFEAADDDSAVQISATALI